MHNLSTLIFLQQLVFKTTYLDYWVLVETSNESYGGATTMGSDAASVDF
jgi:hypothetical protein